MLRFYSKNWKESLGIRGVKGGRVRDRGGSQNMCSAYGQSTETLKGGEEVGLVVVENR